MNESLSCPILPQELYKIHLQELVNIGYYSHLDISGCIVKAYDCWIHPSPIANAVDFTSRIHRLYRLIYPVGGR